MIPGPVASVHYPPTGRPRIPVKNRSLLRAALAVTLALVATSQPLSAQQSCPATTPGATMPLTYQGGPTLTAITACDLMTRLYIYSADSMRGREAGGPEAQRGPRWAGG